VSLWTTTMSSASYFHASNVFYIADRRARPCDGQAARLPRNTRQGAGVESGVIATRDADTHKRSGVPLNVEGSVLPPPTTSSLVATIANAPTLTCDGRTVYLALGGMVWHDGIGWRYRNTSSPRIHDIWNPTLIQAFDERATA